MLSNLTLLLSLATCAYAVHPELHIVYIGFLTIPCFQRSHSIYYFGRTAVERSAAQNVWLTQSEQAQNVWLQPMCNSSSTTPFFFWSFGNCEFIMNYFSQNCSNTSEQYSPFISSQLLEHVTRWCFSFLLFELFTGPHSCVENINPGTVWFVINKGKEIQTPPRYCVLIFPQFLLCTKT